jgi:hypothetical protein
MPPPLAAESASWLSLAASAALECIFIADTLFDNDKTLLETFTYPCAEIHRLYIAVLNKKRREGMLNKACIVAI